MKSIGTNKLDLLRELRTDHDDKVLYWYPWNQTQLYENQRERQDPM
jgi:hypothetical protein